MQFTSDEAYARLISHHMTVPQRIKANGDIVDDDSGPNGMVTGWDYANEKFDMKVPERILVVGQDQHLEFEPVDSAAAGIFPSPGMSANMLGECQAADSAAAGTFPSPETIASTSAGISSSQSGEPVTSLSRLETYNAFVTKSRNLYKNGRPTDLNNFERVDVVMALFGDKLKPIHSIAEHKETFLNAIKTFIWKSEKKYIHCKRNINLFKKCNKDWLSKSFFDDLPDDVKIKGSAQHLSLSTANYTSLSQRQQLRQRRILKQKLIGEPPAKLIKTFTETVMSSSSLVNIPQRACQGMELIINTCIEHPEKAIQISRDIKKSCSATRPQPYTPEEALALIIDTKLSVDSYKMMRQELIQRGFAAYPPYYLILVSKSECYPKEEIHSTENEASVSLQGLIDHTFERIIHTIDDSLTEYCKQQNLSQLDCIFEASWGFDGSTEQSLYKQTHSEEEFDENCMFATTLVPLRISHGNQTIWINPCPQSYRSCRPLHIQYRKESSELIKTSDKSYIENQIKTLSRSFTYTSKNQLVTTSSRLTLCTVDAKVYNTITDTKPQLACPICKLTAEMFNNLELATSKPSEPSALKYGLSPLHCWIRVLEFLLHLSYKNDPAVRVWRIRSNSPQGKIVQKRKTRIQKELKHQLGLLVDVVKQNSGITNDCNTARIALSDNNRQTFTQILGIEQWLVDGLYNILVAVSCGLPVDTTKFGDYCKQIGGKYVAAYGWLPMTLTIHKLLIHGKIIMENSTLPVGMLSELAAESRNKFLRSDRDHDTRKMDRKKKILDLFHRALESSDPVIANVLLMRRQQSLKLIPLPEEVTNMLKYDVKEEMQDEYENKDEDDIAEFSIENPLVLSQEMNIFEDI